MAFAPAISVTGFYTVRCEPGRQARILEPFKTSG